MAILVLQLPICVAVASDSLLGIRNPTFELTSLNLSAAQINQTLVLFFFTSLALPDSSWKQPTQTPRKPPHKHRVT
jgi:hypothetical protein